jgi:hypothetical protein
MRSIIAGSSLAVLLLATGCDHIMPLRPSGSAGVTAENVVPSADRLVTYLNHNADMLGDRALKCTNLSIDCKANGQSVGLGGMLMCQNPRNFRLKAMVLSQPAVDIGSNNEEFWYWISKNEPPYLFHCSYEALARGVNVGFPFQPDMVVAALGIAHYDPRKNYKVEAPPKANYIELIESDTSPQGQSIQKVVVFNRAQADVPTPQVIAYALRDGKGGVICTATVKSVQRNRETGAIIPRVVVFNWPQQNLQMKLELNDVQAVPVDQGMVERVFSRRSLTLPSYDLAARALDGPSGLQRASGTLPPTMPR